MAFVSQKRANMVNINLSMIPYWWVFALKYDNQMTRKLATSKEVIQDKAGANGNHGWVKAIEMI